MVVKKYLYPIRKTADQFTEGMFPKCLACFLVKNKMASRPRFYTSEEVLEEIYADPGSDFDSESSSDEIEEYHDQQSFSESSESEEMSNRSTTKINKQMLEDVV